MSPNLAAMVSAGLCGPPVSPASAVEAAGRARKGQGFGEAGRTRVV